jgi:hypothetical protein
MTGSLAALRCLLDKPLAKIDSLLQDQGPTLSQR